MDYTELLAGLPNDHWRTALYFMLIFGWDDIFIALALMVVASTITALTSKKPSSKDAEPAALKDFQIPSVTEGTAQAVVFGDVWLTNWQVLWYGNLESTAIRSSSSSGGKK